MKPFALVELAEWLVEQHKSAEGYRTSASRSYYGALHCALALLADMNVILPRGTNPHAKVPDLLASSGDKDICKVGDMLKDLHVQRCNADYKIDDSRFETEGFAKQRLTEAKAIVARLKTCGLSKGSAGGEFERVAKKVKDRADFLFLGSNR